MAYIKLLRPKDWAKNLFLFIPLFFAGDLFDWSKVLQVAIGFVCFCCVASSIYVINDYVDREDDRNHPVKKNRPLASGAVSPSIALVIFALLLLAGLGVSFFLNKIFFFLIGAYFVMNMGYSFGLKNISILDIFIVAAGFAIRVKAGGVIAGIDVTIWLNMMVFLLALFMAIGKRRDDALLSSASGVNMRKVMKGYTLDFLNSLLALVSGIIIVSYFMYTVSDRVIERHQTYRLFYTGIFVMAGIMRYLQIIFVQKDSGSPTKILFKDRFIQVVLVLWIISFYFILYIKHIRL
ncbi:MAG: decaprenyl-phosphate phosphoribosyltransferase [Chitinophagaceae bacterium]|nr:decaprenyl-phosphate phosphoribosyltransferase [Chitinophagaceae bacterium]MCW5926926.1 decaprenyl-phosphate phosphoribosyltransferase [Chitinophagaceae bacterium]